MEEYNDDLKCLPTDFVGKSKPSKIIEALYEKHDQGVKLAIENLHNKKQEICKKYDQIFEVQSEELKKRLHELRGFIKNELHDAKITSNKDHATSIGKNYFQNIYKRIIQYTRNQCELVNVFNLNLIKNEKDKSKEFNDILKLTYETIKKNSYKLPNERDELIEMEIENVNQTILANNRNYAELKCQLQLEIENFTKISIHDLQYVKECWVKFFRGQTEKALGELKGQYKPMFSRTAQTLITTLNKGIREEIESIKSVVNNSVNYDQWLKNIQQNLANLDQNAQKIIIEYKQAAVIIYNRFFEELTIIKESLKDTPKFEQYPIEQTETYTPSLEEIEKLYGVEIETIQTIWNSLVEELNNTLNNTYKFLTAVSVLWENHFQRTEILQILILQDMEITVKINNSLCDPIEAKLNVLIDTLRQEPTKEKVHKTFGDIKKLLNSIEQEYNNQYQAEIAILKKYKITLDLKIETLLMEIKRFLELYPPDREKDPKIQRKRASQTSEIKDATENLVPNQMIYCKYQIGAISNWQFGLWEAISNYLPMAKAEILAQTDKWIQENVARLGKRKDIRISIHKTRLQKIEAYIYQERLEEICVHENRSNEHKRAVEQHLSKLKENIKLQAEVFSNIAGNFSTEIHEMENEALESKDSSKAALLLQILDSKSAASLQKLDDSQKEVQNKGAKFSLLLKNSHRNYLEQIKLFSEEGNFSLQEVKSIMKDIDKIKAQTEKNLASINNEIELNKIKHSDIIKKAENETREVLKGVLKEFKFMENITLKRKKLQILLVQEVCKHQQNFYSISKQIEKWKPEIVQNCGNFTNFKNFLNVAKITLEKLNQMLELLNEEEPVKFYSKKSVLDLNNAMPVSSQKGLNIPKAQQRENLQIEQATAKLFNFNIAEEQNTLFVNLNTFLQEYWLNCIEFAKQHFEEHRNNFFLEEEKTFHGLSKFLQHLYCIFHQLQNQCETKVMLEMKMFLKFANDLLIFLTEYLQNFINEYSRKTLKSYEQFHETETKPILLKTQENIKNKFTELRKKLKTSYGYPKNKPLLEKIQIESELIYIEGKELCEDLKEPLINKLDEEFNKVIENYNVLNTEIPTIQIIIDNLKERLKDLEEKLNEKINIVRTMLDYSELDKADDDEATEKVILDFCANFVILYDATDENSFSQFNDNSDLNNSTFKEDSGKSSNGFSIQGSCSDDSAIPSNVDPTINNENAEIEDVFLHDLEEARTKYCKEIANYDMESFLEKLKIEWWFAVKNVLDLYKVKYDTQKNN